jgi:hypothetical protein
LEKATYLRGKDLRLQVKVGDLVRFKATGKLGIYLGLIDEMYTFWSHHFGKVEFWAETYDIRGVEVVSESR